MHFTVLLVLCFFQFSLCCMMYDTVLLSQLIVCQIDSEGAKDKTVQRRALGIPRYMATWYTIRNNLSVFQCVARDTNSFRFHVVQRSWFIHPNPLKMVHFEQARFAFKTLIFIQRQAHVNNEYCDCFPLLQNFHRAPVF